MASITKRGENSYRITVSCGYSRDGKKLFKKKTVSVDPSLTEKKRDKLLNEMAVSFEKEVRNGTYLDGDNLTFEDFINMWMRDYAEVQLAPKTLQRYRELIDKRIVPAMGHLKLSKLQPTHLMAFYKNLSEPGMRGDYKYRMREPMRDKLRKDKVILMSASGVSRATLDRILDGNTTKAVTAQSLASAVGVELSTLFKAVDTDKKLSNRTILHHHRLISSMLTCAVQWQLIDSNPAQRVKPPRVVNGEAHWLDDDEVAHMFTLLEEEPLKYQVAVYIAVLGGLRLGEIVGLQWTDVNFETGVLTINKARQYVSELGVFEKEPKNTSSKRELKLPNVAIAKLKTYRLEQEEEKDKMGEKWIESGNILVREDGSPMFPTTPTNWFAKWISNTDLPYITFHQLRHTSASILIAQGTDVATVSKRLGHSRVSTTTDIYTHSINKMDATAADNLDILFNKNTPPESTE